MSTGAPSTAPHTDPAGGSPAALTFRLGSLAAEFRFRVEHVYAGAGGDFDPLVDDPEGEMPADKILPPVNDTLGRLVGAADRVAELLGGRPGLAAVACRLRRCSEELRDRLVRSWFGPDHRVRIRNRWRLSAEAEGDVDPVVSIVTMVGGSPVGPDAWAAYELAARLFECGLPGAYQPLYALGRLLGRVRWPEYVDHVTAANNDGWARSRRLLAPAIDTALGWAAQCVPRLTSLSDRRRRVDSDAYDHLWDEVDHELSHTPDLGLAARPVTAPSPGEYDRLRRIRRGLLGLPDAGPQDTGGGDEAGSQAYVGDSMPVLRMFEQIEVGRTAGERCLLLLGPMGTGKTSLAALIHAAFTRSGGTAGGPTTAPRPMVRWQASSSQAADQLGPRSHWLGFARNSGYTAVPPAGKPGLLEECRGGSIFVDEFGDLHPDVQTLLLDVAEGRPVIPVGGSVREQFTPDVFLIFATNKDVHSTTRADLLGRVSLQIRLPPLRERLEDLFPLVRHCLRETSHSLSTRTWALLLAHDWPGNVRELEHLLRLVRAAHQVENGTSGGPDGRGTGQLPHALFVKYSDGLRATAGRVGDPDCQDLAEDRVYTFLVEMLSAQGYQVGARRGGGERALFTRMASILGLSAAGVSRMKGRVESRRRANTEVE